MVGIFQKGDHMRTIMKRLSAIIILALLCIGLLVGGSGVYSWVPNMSAVSANGPQLSIQWTHNSPLATFSIF